MKKYLKVLILIIVFCIIFTTCIHANSPFIPTEDLALTNFEFYNNLLQEQELLLINKNKAYEVGKFAQSLGYDNDSYIIQGICKELLNIRDKEQTNKASINQWDNYFLEYPYATYIWLYLTKTLEYNDYVAAGIVGNIMAEVGGNTLDIQYWLYSYESGYYFGMCQWSKDTYPKVRDCDLREQCEFLANTIEYELNTFGYAYHSGYKYINFLNLDSAEEASLMFAKCYERCAQSTYSVRQSNALKAYTYFTGLEA